MKVKRYLANDMNEAMIRIRHELGRDAVILHSRKVKQPGLKGFFGKGMVEVVAAIDEEKTRPESAPAPEKKPEPERPAFQMPVHMRPELEVPEPKKPDPEIEAIKEQVASIQSMLSAVLSGGQKAEPEAQGPAPAAEKGPYHQLLADADLTPESAGRILELAGRQIRLTEENDKAVRNSLRMIIKDQLGVPYTIGGEPETQKVCFFVGPTGVGKTTTLAKLAARLSLIDNRSVGLITADTFRIAAVEQLKTYSEILGIPLTVIYEPDEIKDALSRYKDKDYILVDTAGRSHKNEELEADLSGLIERVANPEIFLVISMTTGYKDIISILDSYHFLGNYKLLFTKLDEASTLGNILNVRMNSGKPLSYFTIGQSVPDDIEVADADKLAKRLLGELS